MPTIRSMPTVRRVRSIFSSVRGFGTVPGLRTGFRTRFRTGSRTALRTRFGSGVLGRIRSPGSSPSRSLTRCPGHTLVRTLVARPWLAKRPRYRDRRRAPRPRLRILSLWTADCRGNRSFGQGRFFLDSRLPLHFLHFVFNLYAEVGGHPAEIRHSLAQHTRHLRQFFRSQDDQRHQEDYDQMRDAEHWQMRPDT